MGVVLSLKEKWEESFINRKRPAVEGLVEDFLGPAAQLDDALSREPLFPGEEPLTENPEKKNETGDL